MNGKTYYLVLKDGNTIPLAERMDQVTRTPAGVSRTLTMIVSALLDDRLIATGDLSGVVMSEGERLKGIA